MTGEEIDAFGKSAGDSVNLENDVDRKIRRKGC